MKIVLAGGTGFIGAALLKEFLLAGYQVTLLTRNPNVIERTDRNAVKVEIWDAQSSGTWTKQIEEADAVINLAGYPIAQSRWTQAVKDQILNSRVNATRAIVNAIGQAKTKPTVLINASAVGYYGDVESGDVTENQSPGTGFLPATCVAWENEAKKVEALGVRLVMTRIGVVLGEEGGALAKILPPFQMFMGGPLGSGRQWFPWIHRSDVAGAILFAIQNKNLSGSVNLTSPNPVTMKEFCSTLGRVLNRPSWAPVPAFALQLVLGEMAEMLLTGQRAVPQKLIQAGYSFHHPNLQEALDSILKK